MQKLCVGWGLIPNCNLSCEFCYSKTTRLKGGGVGYDDWVYFIDNNYNYIESINYGTGENTLSLEWFQLIKHIRRNYPQIRQALTTNGFLVEQVKKDVSLHEAIVNSIDEIDVSLDFSNKDRHNQLRGNTDVYNWAVDTLQFCRDNKILSTIVFLGTNQVLEEKNIDGLFSIADTYNAKLRMNIYRPTNPVENINNKFIVSYEKIINALYYIDNNYKILSLSDPLFSSILTDGHYKMDHSGINSIRILHNGSITPSTYLITENFQRCNITEKDVLKKIKETNIFQELDIIPSECGECGFCKTCKGGVYDRRYLWNKSFAKRDPYCPFNEGNFLPRDKVTIRADEDFTSIHDGYLPTMFFST